TGELSGFYTAPSVWQGAFKTKALGSLDAGIQQGLFKGKVTAKATVTDGVRTFHFSSTNNKTAKSVTAKAPWESQQFRINFSYRIGSIQVNEARQPKSSIEDENKRTQGGGGIGVGN